MLDRTGDMRTGGFRILWRGNVDIMSDFVFSLDIFTWKLHKHTRLILILK